MFEWSIRPFATARTASIGSNRSIGSNGIDRIERHRSIRLEIARRATSIEWMRAVDGERDTRSSRDRSMEDVRVLRARTGRDGTIIHRSIETDRPRGRSPVARRVARVRRIDGCRIAIPCGAGRDR
jgi:hypothetical protein